MKNNLDTVQTLVRAILKIGGGYLVARGIADENGIEIISAGLVTLIAVLWGVWHRTKPAPEKPSPTQTTLLFLLLSGSLALTGCASPSNAVFRAEQLATDAAYAGFMAWEAYYGAASSNAAPSRLEALQEQNEQVREASRNFAAAMMAADALREMCLTNRSPAHATALRLSLERAVMQSSNVVWLSMEFQVPSSEKGNSNHQ